MEDVYLYIVKMRDSNSNSIPKKNMFLGYK